MLSQNPLVFSYNLLCCRRQGYQTDDYTLWKEEEFLVKGIFYKMTNNPLEGPREQCIGTETAHGKCAH